MNQRRKNFQSRGLVTTRRSILGPPAEGRPGPSDGIDDDGYDDYVDVMMIMVLVVWSADMIVPHPSSWSAQDGSNPVRWAGLTRWVCASA